MVVFSEYESFEATIPWEVNPVVTMLPSFVASESRPSATIPWAKLPDVMMEPISYLLYIWDRIL